MWNPATLLLSATSGQMAHCSTVVRLLLSNEARSPVERKLRRRGEGAMAIACGRRATACSRENSATSARKTPYQTLSLADMSRRHQLGEWRSGAWDGLRRVSLFRAAAPSIGSTWSGGSCAVVSEGREWERMTARAGPTEVSKTAGQYE